MKNSTYPSSTPNSSTSKTNHRQLSASGKRQLFPPRKATAQQHHQIHADTKRPRRRSIKRTHRPNPSRPHVPTANSTTTNARLGKRQRRPHQGIRQPHLPRRLANAQA